MVELKFCSLLSVVFLIFYLRTTGGAGNYTIGFEKFGNSKPSPTHAPKPNPTRPPPTYRPSSAKPYPTYRPSSAKPNPTYRPTSARPNTYRPPSVKPNPTYRPSTSKPNPTYRPTSPKPYYPPPPNPTYHPVPPKPNPTYWPPKTNPSTTTRSTTRRTTPKPTPPPKPTSPPLWNIWTSNYVPSQATPSLSTKNPTNNFKSDPTLLGLYTRMRSIVGVTLTQAGQDKPVKKALHESYPYYYAVYHYNRDREKVASKILVPYDSIGYCEAGTSDRSCVPGTYALCLLDWSIMCVTYATATFPCHFNASLQCAMGRIPCDNRDPICASMGNQMEVQTPCISNVLVTSRNEIMGGITQTVGPDPYAAVASGPIELCATTILEMKKLESPVGAVVGFLSELGKVHLDVVNNFNASMFLGNGPVQAVTVMP